MEPIQSVKEAFKEVYHDKSYFFLTSLIALSLFSLNGFIRNYRIIFSDFSFKLLFGLTWGIFVSYSKWSLISLITMSLLTGVVISFSIFLLRRQISSSVSIGASGVVMAIIAPSCPSCAISIASVLGLGGLFAFLPFGGLEFGFLSIILLMISIFYLSKKIATKVCEVKR